jgi:hypothetical protein
VAVVVGEADGLAVLVLQRESRAATPSSITEWIAQAGAGPPTD